MLSPIFTKDGDTLVLIAQTPICASDPTDERKFISTAYRVVADRVDPTLELVPLQATPIIVEASDIEQYERRVAQQKLEELVLNGNAVKVLELLVKTTGWKGTFDIVKDAR